MLTLQVIRQETQKVKLGLEKKCFKELHLIDEILNIDEQRRSTLSLQEKNAAEINQYSKKIGQLISQNNTSEIGEIKLIVANLKDKNVALNIDLEKLEKQQNHILLKLPNLPSEQVPLGKTPQDNDVIKINMLDFVALKNPLPHWDLCKKFNLIDFELGNKVTGAGFPFYIHQGSKLVRSLINYFIDFNTHAGYQEYSTPLLVNADSAYGTGQLPDKEGQMYHVTIDDLFLIPTAEVPLTNMFRNEIIDVKKLPICVTGYTPCFRREAGSYGKDVRGLNRLHQFDKVEIVQIIEPENSYRTLQQMVGHVEKLLQTLQLPYRILKLCAGDMSFSSALTFDFEVFSSAQDKWLEVSSVSNFESFQTNRMKIRYKDISGKTQLLHSLNGSSLALPRIMAALLENNQTENFISLPSCLHAYFGNNAIVLNK